jgi:DNA invertase Pin-like site-specific DNA recombinase
MNILNNLLSWFITSPNFGEVNPPEALGDKSMVIYTRTSSRTTFKKTSILRQVGYKGDEEKVSVFSEQCKDQDPLKERQIWLNMIKFVREENLKILCLESIDRISRDSLVLLEAQRILRKAGIKKVICQVPYFTDFLTATKEDICNFSRTQQYSKDLLVVKLKSTRAVLKSQGIKCGGNPVSIKKYLEDEGFLQVYIDKCVGQSLRNQAKILGDYGYKTSNNTVLSLSTLAKIRDKLKNYEKKNTA